MINAQPGCQISGVVVAMDRQERVSETSKLSAIQAVETIDRCLARVVPAFLELGGTALITADHGNIEQMKDPASGGVHTAHTTNLVPFVVCSDALIGRSLKDGGRLCDIATTLLPLLGLDKSPEMEGVDLFA